MENLGKKLEWKKEKIAIKYGMESKIKFLLKEVRADLSTAKPMIGMTEGLYDTGVLDGEIEKLEWFETKLKEILKEGK